MKTKYGLAFMIVGLLAAGQAFADKPATAGGNQNSEQRGQPEQAQGKKPDASGSQNTDMRQDADKGQDSDRGQGANKGEPGGQSAAGQGAAAGSGAHRHFGDQHRNAVREYYTQEFRHGHCPPGLAKRENGCMPPGQAKSWAVGQRLPRDVTFHNLPAQLATQLGQPPAGQRYVRAADEILLIESGTGLIIDAIPGLGMQ